MCGKCIRSKAQTVQRMPESNLSRAHKQGCRLLCAFGERGRRPSQRTLRRGALEMLVRDNGLGLKKTSLNASRAEVLLPGDLNIYRTLMRVSSFLPKQQSNHCNLLIQIHDQPLLHFNMSTLSFDQSFVMLCTGPGSTLYSKLLYIVIYTIHYNLYTHMHYKYIQYSTEAKILQHASFSQKAYI